MIERVYLKNHLSFDEVELNFSEVELNLSKGLMIFTGPSGAGKSVLLQGILAIFAYFDANAQLSEAIIDDKIDLSDFGIDIEADEEIIFKEIKKEKARYFINNQAVSKKIAKKIADEFIDYLSLRNADEFKNENILQIIDKFADNDISNYQKLFFEYKSINKELKEIIQKEKKAEDLKEFLNFEINKIEAIAPKIGEFEELIDIKKNLSKIEKLKSLRSNVENIFEFERVVDEFLTFQEIDTSFFDEAMNELRSYMDLADEKAEFLETINIEEVLNRLEELQGLIKRFGSIEESLKYLDEKRVEFEKLKNISFEKDELIHKQKVILNKIKEKADKITKKREGGLSKFEKNINEFLQKLYMPNAKLILKDVPINQYGKDEIILEINNTKLNELSTGEFNRLRLAFLAAKIDYENREKSLFLDEIDANLSGEESMSVAEVLKFLSKKYQIFAISHQPQLTSKADKHFFVGKDENKSFVKELNYGERVNEIARIISGKKLKKEAVEYAKKLLNEGLK
jgi:DNA repair protein RecN (Recombination protein N)